MTRLSIAMATFNGAQFIREQLDSFGRQTRLPDELVVTDDASTDQTAEIVEEFARSAPFSVSLHRNPENLGFVQNFERALSLCSGDIIFLSDQDDVWNDDKLAVIESRFAQEPATQVIINDALLVDAALKSQGNTQLANIRRAGGSERSFFTGCCSAHRRGWQDLALPLPENARAHDWWINTLAIELGCATHIEDVLQSFRRHDSNASGWILSDPTGVSGWRALRAAGVRDARGGWQMRIELLRQFVTRLRDCEGLVKSHGWDGKMPQLEAEIAAIEQRIAICSLPRTRRVGKILQHWAAGGYGRAAGWKSTVKDLIRP